MSEYSAKIAWTRQPNEAFTDNKYSRGIPGSLMAVPSLLPPLHHPSSLSPIP